VTLTRQQREVVDAAGDFLLLACPGSGKTRSAAERVARLSASPGTRVAVCSYTNVGAERLGSVLAQELGVTLNERHFVGTIHAFLLRYVVYPFAHLLGAQQGPYVREGGSWPTVRVCSDNAKRIAIDAFRRDASGGLILTNKPRTIPESDEVVIASVGSEVLRIKGQMFRSAGVLTADDAIWVALHLLRNHPNVCAAVAARFDELVLDEAQDTSELQLACLRELRRSGRLESLVLIGDLEQSIFSFQGASAEGCRRLASECALREVVLNENHRSSQRICNVAVHFSTRDQPDRAVGRHADCPIEPEVVLYPHNDPTAAMHIFRTRLHHHGIAHASAAVLARYWKMADALNGEHTSLELRDRARTLGKVAAKMTTGTLTRHDIRAVERIVSYCALDTRNLDELDGSQRDAVRRQTYRLLAALPTPQGDLQTWMRTTSGVLQAAAVSVFSPPKHTGARTLPTGQALAGHDAADVFAAVHVPPRAQTVHSIKGEDREAVMVVVRRDHASDPASQLELWEATVGGTTIEHSKQEERRVLFVALTRAQKYCLVALPDDSRGRTVAAACIRLGFAGI
jgi:DNA helicase-2/ATP-dependent DNA helicase PcrA